MATKEQKREYYLRNKEILHEKYLIYYAENKDRLIAKRKDYYEKNKDRVKAWRKQYNIDNADVIAEKLRIYRKAYKPTRCKCGRETKFPEQKNWLFIEEGKYQCTDCWRDKTHVIKRYDNGTIVKQTTVEEEHGGMEYYGYVYVKSGE